MNNNSNNNDKKNIQSKKYTVQFSHCPMSSILLSKDSPPLARSPTLFPRKTSHGIEHNFCLLSLDQWSDRVPSWLLVKINLLPDEPRTIIFSVVQIYLHSEIADLIHFLLFINV